MCDYCDYKNAFDELCDLQVAYLHNEFDTAQFLHRLGILICEYSLSISENFEFTPSPAAMSGKRKEKNVSTRQNCRN